MPSMDVLRALHDDAQQSARSRVLFASALLVPLLALMLVVGTAPLAFPLLFLAVGVVGYFGDAVFEWWLVRRKDPIELWRADVEAFDAGREHDMRLARAVPVASSALGVLIAAVTLVQFVGPGVRESIALAALVKPSVVEGEWWRLLSVAFLHGNFGHLLSNVGALVVFGPMIEIYDRPLRVPLVMLVGVIAGAVASTLFSTMSSVGASGGILGLAGYLLAADVRLHTAPEWMRRRLTHGLAATAFIGIIGFYFIDNAAHVGGFVGGLVVGRLARRAKRSQDGLLSTRLDAAGWISALVLIVGAVFTTGRLLQAW